MPQRTGMSAAADRYGFVAIYPDGLSYPSAGKAEPPAWNWGFAAFTHAPYTVHVDDVHFVSVLIDALAQQLCVDPHRIYVTGFSAGGSMTDRLGCDLSSRIAAIAPISGLYPWTYTHCRTTRPVPVISFHSEDDPTNFYAGDASEQAPSVPAWARKWAKRDGCVRGPTPFFHYVNSVLGYHSDAVRYTQCHGGAQVELYTVSTWGHGWPPPVRIRGKLMSATDLIWQFFKSHILR